jgi:hypothetical protein
MDLGADWCKMKFPIQSHAEECMLDTFMIESAWIAAILVDTPRTKSILFLLEGAEISDFKNNNRS